MKEKLTLIKVGGKIVEEESTLNQLLADFSAIELSLIHILLYRRDLFGERKLSAGPYCGKSVSGAISG